MTRAFDPLQLGQDCELTTRDALVASIDAPTQ